MIADLAFDLCNLLIKGFDELIDALGNVRVKSVFLAVEFLNTHGDQLPASAHKRLDFLAYFVYFLLRRRLKGLGKISDNTCVNFVCFSHLALAKSRMRRGFMTFTGRLAANNSATRACS